MNHTIIKKILLLTAFCCLNIISKAQEITLNFYHGEWAEVAEKALSENKIIFVDVYADYCPPCKTMDRVVFSDQEVAMFQNEYFVNYKVNLSKREFEYFQSLHNITELPSLLYFTPKGELIRKETGCKDIPEFLGMSKQVLGTQATNVKLVGFNEKNKQYQELEKWYTNGKQSNSLILKGKQPDEMLREYAYLLKEYRLPYNRVINDYLKTQSNFKTATNRKLIYDFSNNIENNAIYQFVEDISYFKEQYGSNRINDKIKTAAYNSTIIALRERDFDLFKQVETLIVKSNIPNINEYLFYLQSIFYEGVNDWATYAKIAQKYITDQHVSDPEILNKVSYKFYQHVENKKLLEEAIKWMNKSVKIENEYENNAVLAWLYSKLGKNKKAQEYVLEAQNVLSKSKDGDYLFVARLKEKLAE